MDAWQDRELKIMKLGGNRKFVEFLKQQKFPDGISIKQRYNTTACKLYREYIKALVRGEHPDPIPFVGYQEDDGFSSFSKPRSNISSMSSSSSSNSNKKSKKKKKDRHSSSS